MLESAFILTCLPYYIPEFCIAAVKFHIRIMLLSSPGSPEPSLATDTSVQSRRSTTHMVNGPRHRHVR